MNQKALRQLQANTGVQVVLMFKFYKKYNNGNKGCWQFVMSKQLVLHLLFLDLSYNHLSGTIPSSLGQLTNLQYLELFGNQLSERIPSSLGQLASLQSLSLDQLTSLQYLDLTFNQLTAIDMTNGFPNLDSCDLYANPFICPIPQWTIDHCLAFCN